MRFCPATDHKNLFHRFGPMSFAALATRISKELNLDKSKADVLRGFCASFEALIDEKISRALMALHMEREVEKKQEPEEKGIGA